MLRGKVISASCTPTAEVCRSDAQAVKWWRKTSEQGYADAQSSLGIAYVNGTGAPKDNVLVS